MDTDSQLGHNHLSHLSASPQSPNQMTIHEAIKPFYILSKLVGFSWYDLPGYKWRLGRHLDRILMLVHVTIRSLHIYWTLIMAPVAKFSPITHTLRDFFMVIATGLPHFEWGRCSSQ